MSKQVDGRGRGVARIRPGQKRYKDYGLPSVKNYSPDLLEQTPEVLAGAKSLKSALKKVDEFLLRGQEWRRVNTLLEPVVIHRRHIDHILIKRDQQREKFINWIIPTLTEPNEIWLTEYDDGFRRHFIKLFKGKKNMLVIARENKDGSLFWNAIPAKSKYIDRRRVGRLLYRRKQ